MEARPQFREPKSSYSKALHFIEEIFSEMTWLILGNFEIFPKIVGLKISNDLGNMTDILRII